MYKNVDNQRVIVQVYDQITGKPFTSDISSAITGYYSQDGGPYTPFGATPAASHPTPIGAGVRGAYAFTVSAAQSNCDLFLVSVDIDNAAYPTARADALAIYTSAQSPSVDLAKIGGSAIAATQAKDFFGTVAATGGLSAAAQTAIWSTDLAAIASGAGSTLKDARTNTLPATLVPNVFNFAFTGDAAPFNVPSGYPATLGEAFTWLFARFGHGVAEYNGGGFTGSISVYARSGFPATVQSKNPATDIAIGEIAAAAVRSPSRPGV